MFGLGLQIYNGFSYGDGYGTARAVAGLVTVMAMVQLGRWLGLDMVMPRAVAGLVTMMAMVQLGRWLGLDMVMASVMARAVALPNWGFTWKGAG